MLHVEPSAEGDVAPPGSAPAAAAELLEACGAGVFDRQPSCSDRCSALLAHHSASPCWLYVQSATPPGLVRTVQQARP